MNDSSTFEYPLIGHLNEENIFADSIYQSLHQSLFSEMPKVDSATTITSFYIKEPAPLYEQKPKENQPFDWFFCIIIIFSFALVFIRLFTFKGKSLFFSSLTNLTNYEKKRIKNDNMPSFFSSHLMLSSSFCVIVIYSLLLTSLYRVFVPVDFLLKPFLITFLFVTLYLFLQFLLEKTAGFVFNLNQCNTVYLGFNFLIRFVFCVLLFPLIVINQYYPFAHWHFVLLALFSLYFVFKIIKSRSLFAKNIKWYEYFLYLCTLEILPLALVIKFLFIRFISN